MNHVLDASEISLFYMIDDEAESVWVFLNHDGQKIAEISQPDMKAAFLAGMRYALGQVPQTSV